VGQRSFTVKLCGAIPKFPFNTGTDGIDSGVNYQVCVDANAQVATKPVYITTGHRGGGTYDGPYPPAMGYRFCSFVGVSVGSPNNSVIWAAGVWDPIGQLTYFDQNSLHDLAGTPTINPPTCNAGTVATGFFGCTQITFWLPDALVYTTGAASTGTCPARPCIINSDKLVSETFLNPPPTPVNDWSVTTSVSLEALTLPLAVCLDTGLTGNGGGQPTTPGGVVGHSCDNPPPGCCDILNPITGVVSLNVTTDSAPGVEWCTPTPVISCGANAGFSWDYGIAPIGYPAEALIDPNPTTGVAACTLSYNYYPQKANPLWSGGFPGQGGWPGVCTTSTVKLGPAGDNQDRGDACSVSLSACAPGTTAGTAVPQVGSYTSVYGRGPNPIVRGVYHLQAQYNFGTGNSYT
jgi:hypothetical protein